ncbi:MAG TPA: hypothetical protein PKY81_05425 [bacterium]|nr:hypothetical protein [bacterium]
MSSINVSSSYSNYSSLNISASSSKSSSIASASPKNYNELYTFDSDSFVKSFNIASIYNSSSNQIDWEKVEEELCVQYDDNEGPVSGSSTEIYNLKTGDSFDEVIMRYSLIKSTIQTDKSKDPYLKEYLEKLDVMFDEEITRLSNILGIQFTNFYTGNFSGQVEYPLSKKTTKFDTAEFVDSTIEMIKNRCAEFQEYIKKNNYNWTEYREYVSGDSAYLTHDFLDYLKQTDTEETGTKSAETLNFAELNAVSKLMYSLNNNFDVSKVYLKENPETVKELIAGTNIGLAMLKVSLMAQEFEISTESSTLLSKGVLKNISNTVDTLMTDKDLSLIEDNIYLYGGYISELSSYQAETSFTNKFDKAFTSIKKYFTKTDSESDYKKALNSFYSDWNNYVKFLDFDKKDSFILTAPSSSSIDITT